MKWAELRERYPNQFVLVEAMAAYSKDKKRMIEDVSLIGQYESVSSAWEKYKEIHRAFPERELYIFHTSKEQMEVEEQYFTGIRGSVCR
ncbi:hypothetical protein GCM10008982_27110 [Anoxybacillus voinovskiensis]|nr:hypothetical protein GCM10008982_27110 [Anoxybacillus voinovskiensis]